MKTISDQVSFVRSFLLNCLRIKVEVLKNAYSEIIFGNNQNCLLSVMVVWHGPGSSMAFLKFDFSALVTFDRACWSIDVVLAGFVTYKLAISSVF